MARVIPRSSRGPGPAGRRGCRIGSRRLSRDTPPVTVVIPVWDQYVRFLPEAVDSVRRDDPHVPIVVVDNASTTHVPDLEGTVVIRLPRRVSIGSARNRGIERVESRYIVVLDADDMLLPGSLEALATALDGDPAASAHARSIIEGESGNRHRTPRRFAPALARLRRAFAFFEVAWSLFPTQGCTMMRTAEVRDAGGYADADWGEDWVLAVSLAFRGRIRIDNTPALYYRSHGQSQWRTRRVSAGELTECARLVRERVRRDVAIPPWGRALLPIGAVLQLVVIYGVRPLYIGARRLGGLTRQG